ncbi:MAG: hypothetical protein K940chlam2_01054 [Chlamydiae bacterium]|nr:hypothetical protein [Chlamydiota bacterium]
MLRFFAIALVILFSAGCTNPPYRGYHVYGAEDFVLDSYCIREGKYGILEMEGTCFEPLSEELLNEYADTIQNGDILSIIFYHPSRKELAAAITAISEKVGFQVIDGKITLPDFEAVEVEGLTLNKAKEALDSALRSEMQDAETYVAYKDKAERRVELMGLVSTSSIPVNGKLRLFETLSRAKVPPSANLFKSYVVRDSRLLPVDLQRLVQEGDMSQNVVMQGGDKVYIAEPSASNFMVMGEVGKPQVIDLPSGSMPLRQALAQAGGISFTGDRRFIQVIRGNLIHPKVYTLNWKHIVELPTNSLLVMPGDIVYVAATPIAEWDRFVNQILPTIVGLDILLKGAKNVGITLP